MNEETEDPRNWSKPSRAVIAYDGKRGIVLWYVGPHVESMIEQIGGSDIEELGFEGDPLKGISVWEGKITGGYYNSHTGDFNDCYLTGEYRAPTDEEWASIRAATNPWNVDEWMLVLDDPKEQCLDCGAFQPHHCLGVPK
jgi:hypothetical protein